MRIALSGYMGCGKSTVGRVLAKKANLEFFDTDALIEAREGRTIAQIFTEIGESGFRDLEFAVIDELLDCKDGIVLGLGGGAITDARTAQALARKAVVVLLDVSFEVCYGRIAGKEKRPIVMEKNKDELRAHYEARIKRYRDTAAITEPAYGSPEKIAERILARLHQKGETHVTLFDR